jgi:hypothetical protein
MPLARQCRREAGILNNNYQATAEIDLMQVKQ